MSIYEVYVATCGDKDKGEYVVGVYADVNSAIYSALTQVGLGLTEDDWEVTHKNDCDEQYEWEHGEYTASVYKRDIQ